jgi:hypothetical protein
MHYWWAEGIIGVWESFRPHFVALMDALLNSRDPVAECVAGPFWFMSKLERDFVVHVFGHISGCFEEPLNGQMAGLIDEQLRKVAEVVGPDGLVRVGTVLGSFRRTILSYSIRMLDISEFTPIFTN